MDEEATDEEATDVEATDEEVPMTNMRYVGTTLHLGWAPGAEWTVTNFGTIGIRMPLQLARLLNPVQLEITLFCFSHILTFALCCTTLTRMSSLPMNAG